MRGRRPGAATEVHTLAPERPKGSGWKYVPRIWPYLKSYWGLAAGTAALVLLASAVSLLAPWPLKVLVDHVLEDRPAQGLLASLVGAFGRTDLLLVVVFAGLAITLAENVINVLHNYVTTKLEQRMILDFRGDLFQHVQRLSLTFHDRMRAGGLMYRINNQANSVGRVTLMIPPLIQNALTLVGMFYIAYRIDAELALLSLTVTPFLYYSVGYYTTHIEDRLRKVKGMEGRSLSIVHEAMSMLRVIVAFGRESHEYRRFRDQGETAVDERVKLTVRQTLFSLVVNTITAAGTALVLGFGAYKVLQGALTVGELLVVLAYIASVYTPLQQISSAIGALNEQVIGLQFAFELLDVDPEIVDAPDAREIDRPEGRIVFEDVGFSYPSREDTLSEVTFEVLPGQVAALVGPTGAGKSTLVSLIPRFYDPDTGRILLDGTDLRKIRIRSLREQISMVLQEPLLFSGTIADNIRYGRLDAPRDAIEEAARDAGAHDFIAALPGGYKTRLGERGAQLSGGERQRISIARAFLKDAPVLILDEPTSAIDSKTEGVILDALDRLMVGRTTFLIAHRLSTIRSADLVVVLRAGRVVESGTWEELLDREDGLFRQLHDVQVGQIQRRRPAGAAGGGP